MNKGLKLLPILGILLILGGYFYFTVKTIKSKEALEASKAEQKALDKVLAMKRDSVEIVTAQLLEAQNNIKSMQQARTLEEVKEIAGETKIELKSINTEFVQKKEAEQGEQPSGAIVYIQAGSKTTHDRLEQLGLVQKLENHGYKAFGYDLENGKFVDEIRYFNPDDADKARELQQQLKAIDPKLELKVSQVKGYKVPAGQVEIWVE